ncbi:hypothetical protein C405_07173 [Stenotrophomonas maltophilia AU12-09]|nr:hypothetical protein C405_07173 [Stenotrophomonas maltophilia AU12-09]PZT08342.1 hypothetical protein A7X87_04310 [Stenotrophomonas maltophilia]
MTGLSKKPLLLASSEVLASSPCRELRNRQAVAAEVPEAAAAEALVELADSTLAEAAMETAVEVAAGSSR